MVAAVPIVLSFWAFISPCVLSQSTTVASGLASNASSSTSSTMMMQNSSMRASTPTSATQGLTAIGGPAASGSSLSNSSTTVSARPSATNTTPCNGYPEFCNRRFSNISMVLAHNSPFVRPRNAASNQVYPVLNQLNDGARGLSFETQKPNDTSGIRLCHTSCDLLDVGTLDAYLTTVREWLDYHPYEVISIQMGNNNGQSTRIPLVDYVSSFQNAGMMKYVYTPPARAMNLTDWPTLGEMILRNQRVVVTMDAGTDQDQAPWLLQETNYQWATPFSPTDPSFPCTQQQPAGQAEEVSRNRMYLMNHNLNIDITLAGISILVPAYGLLDQINAVSGNGSLGLSVHNCQQMWGRPPNWLLVDYYNFGNFNGSVFQVAATANGVTYTQGTCCGTNAQSAGSLVARPWTLLVASLFLALLR